MAYRCKNFRGDYDGMIFQYWQDAYDRAQALDKIHYEAWNPEKIPEVRSKANAANNSISEGSDNVGVLIAGLFSIIWWIIIKLLGTGLGRKILLLFGCFFAIVYIHNVWENRTYVETAYYEDGKVKSEQSFKLKQLNGVSKYYFPNGKLEKEQNYKNGKLDGVSIFYYESGNKKKEQTYKNNVKNGASKVYYPNGKLQSEAMIVNNKLHGISKLYDEKGKLLRQEKFINGKPTNIIE